MPAASSGPNSSVCKDEMSVSRPNTVMNHGVPAASSRPPTSESPARMRSPARSATDVFHVCTRPSQRARSRGADARHAASDSSARRRSSSSSRANDALANGSTPSSCGCTPTTSRQRSPGASESANRAAPCCSPNGSDRCTIVRAGYASSANTSVPFSRRSSGRDGGSVSSLGVPKPGSRLFTTKMSAKSASSSRPSSTSTRRWPWFSTVMRSSMQSPTNRSRSIESSFGSSPSASGLRSTNAAMCGAG